MNLSYKIYTIGDGCRLEIKFPVSFNHQFFLIDFPRTGRPEPGRICGHACDDVNATTSQTMPPWNTIILILFALS